MACPNPKAHNPEGLTSPYSRPHLALQTVTAINLLLFAHVPIVVVALCLFRVSDLYRGLGDFLLSYLSVPRGPGHALPFISSNQGAIEL